MSWAIELYEDEAGKRPVEEFLERLPEQQVGKILQVLQMLEEWGHVSRSPIRARSKDASASYESTMDARSIGSSTTPMRSGPLCCCMRLRNGRRPSRKASFRWR